MRSNYTSQLFHRNSPLFVNRGTCLCVIQRIVVCVYDIVVVHVMSPFEKSVERPEGDFCGVMISPIPCDQFLTRASFLYAFASVRYASAFLARQPWPATVP